MPIEWNLYIIVLVKMFIRSLLHGSLEIVTTLYNLDLFRGFTSSFLMKSGERGDWETGNSENRKTLVSGRSLNSQFSILPMEQSTPDMEQVQSCDWRHFRLYVPNLDRCRDCP
jgi:hypothetical protein